MRPQNALDWIAFVFLMIGAFAWGYFVTDVNILDVALERIWDPLDDVVFILIALSGFYWLIRAFASKRSSSISSRFPYRRDKVVAREPGGG